ncbi:thiamine biosynthesis protein ThiS [Nocardiopsis kunsanensis]|uniref:Thiamine biosynthesis protein ThiS n=1 Tax=Nocardiopsis kunsanensis TaxID=141693 RepID=A0A919CL88_9ACTN|nr:sulfur carrier protein ThiS [Nocardiopsis kunsanensis]GHD36149.1 thiamine biosynthesis protein ThiS [Nocardiopsis kunsanensis]
MRLTVNNEEHTYEPDTTVEAVVRELTASGGGEVPGGIAVAVNDEVVRRTAWASTRLGAGDRVDVLTAVQGG